ncbi:MAG: DUF1947 domain-containing protein [Candidatus Verstraetearchaeota archaeon]|nr:DUF1947 domain-containing protein [Candidatus Verstraetearchaeota archaeon]
MILKKRHPLSSKEQKELLEEVRDKYPFVYEVLDRKRPIELLETSKGEIVYLQDGRPFLFRMKEILVPCLRACQEIIDTLPKVVVDMGAVPFIVNGADVMAPGIREVDDRALSGSVAVVVEEKYRKPLAVGIMLMDPKDIREKKKGKAVKNVHHVGDELWKFTE